MKRLRCSWAELQATPAMVVQEAILDMQAEGEASQIRKRWANR